MKAHRTDLVSFAFGLLFLALAAWWLSAQLLGLALPPVGWFLAGALIVIGVLGLVGALRSGRYADRDATANAGGPVPGEPAGGQAPDEFAGAVPGARTGETAPDLRAGAAVGPTGSPVVERPVSGDGPGWGADRPTSGGILPGWGPEQPTAGGIHPRWESEQPTDTIHPRWESEQPTDTHSRWESEHPTDAIHPAWRADRTAEATIPDATGTTRPADATDATQPVDATADRSADSADSADDTDAARAAGAAGTADERPTEAVTDTPVAATEDRPSSGPGTDPWPDTPTDADSPRR